MEIFQALSATKKIKRRLKFGGYIDSVASNRLTYKIVNCIQKIKTTRAWVKQVRTNLDKAQISSTEVSERNLYRHTIHEWKAMSEKISRKIVNLGCPRKIKNERIKTGGRSRKKEKKNMQSQKNYCNGTA